jgi:hypothetical protein
MDGGATTKDKLFGMWRTCKPEKISRSCGPVKFMAGKRLMLAREEMVDIEEPYVKRTPPEIHLRRGL